MELKINKEFLGCFDKCKKGLKPNAIVIHHTCTSCPKKTRSALKSQGYSTHFEVDVDGEIYQYTEIDRICSHCGSSNFECIGIDVTHLSNAEFPQAQIDAVKRLVDHLCSLTGIPHIVHKRLSGIYPHNALCNTECPQNFPLDELGNVE